MQKPKNFDDVKVGGDFIPITLGGHHLIIKQVNETKSKKGKDMLVILFDFAKNDSQPGYFNESFKNDIRPDKKWPHAATKYVVTEDDDGKCTRNFKSFITSFEKSNNVEAIWGAKFTSQFKNKKIGGVFGEVENDYDGKITMRRELRWFCDDDKADAASIPAPKYLPKNDSNNSGFDDGFAEPPTADEEEEIPWG